MSFKAPTSFLQHFSDQSQQHQTIASNRQLPQPPSRRIHVRFRFLRIVVYVHRRLQSPVQSLTALISSPSSINNLLKSNRFLQNPGSIFLDPQVNFEKLCVFFSNELEKNWIRAFVYEGFLTDLECDHLISLAKENLQRFAVADNENKESQVSDVWKISDTFISKGKDPIVSGIEDKLSTWTFLLRENGEDLHVLRYEHGQKYDAHFDYFHDKVNIARGGHRIATVLMYLSNVTKGGETVFHDAVESSCRKLSVNKDDLSDCAKKLV